MHGQHKPYRYECNDGMLLLGLTDRTRNEKMNDTDQSPDTVPATADFRNRLSLFQRILLATDGTVTDLIALYTGETIRVKKIEQGVLVDTAPAMLACEGPAKLLRRKILLTGTNANYLFAESVFVFERFSLSIQNQLLNTDRPIGLLWKDERLETYREIVAHEVRPCGDIAEYFGLPPDAPFVARTYVIHHAGRPLGVITEKWPLSFFRGAID